LFSIGRWEDKMTFVPCEWYYEHILGDNCNNDCNNCFGDKDIRICVNDFQVVEESVLHKKIINKGSLWACKFENDTHLVLENVNGKELIISRKLYDKNFKDYIIED
jgi:hypothetical protein